MLYLTFPSLKYLELETGKCPQGKSGYRSLADLSAMSTLQSLSLSSPGCFHSSLAFEQVVFVFFLTFFILRKMVDLPQIIPCSPEVHVQNYIFATMKYSLEFMWNKSVHAFIQYLLCDRWCLWGQHFKGKRMPPHQREHRAWVTTKDWASTPPDCYKAQLFPDVKKSPTQRHFFPFRQHYSRI